jgi:hypothetical protein
MKVSRGLKSSWDKMQKLKIFSFFWCSVIVNTDVQGRNNDVSKLCCTYSCHLQQLYMFVYILCMFNS